MNYLVVQGGENKFSISVHSRPGFLFNKATTRSVYFLNRQVNDSIQVLIRPVESYIETTCQLLGYLSIICFWKQFNFSLSWCLCMYIHI